MNWIFALIGLSWIAAFTSQSLVDISDTLVLGFAVFLAFKKQDWTALFKGFKPGLLWPVWIGIILIGLVLNADLQSKLVWQDFFEFRWILTFLCWVYLFVNLKDQKKLFDKLAIITIVLNIGALIMWLRNPEERAGGLLNAVMSFAHNIGPVFCVYAILTLTNWKSFNNKEKSIYATVVITSGFLILATLTRGVWIGSVIALLATTFLWNKKIFTGVVGSFVVLLLIGITTNERFANRVLTKTANETESNQERKALWRANWEMVKEHPVVGVGLGTNKSHLRKHYDNFGLPETQRQSHAHNQYLQYWAGTGTLGLICYLAFLFILLKYAYGGFKSSSDTQIKYFQLALMAGLICFMVGSLTESNFNIAKNRFFFLLLAGAAVALSKPPKKI